MPETLSRQCVANLHSVSEYMGAIRAEAEVNNGQVRYAMVDGLLGQSAKSITECVSVNGVPFRQGAHWQEDLIEQGLAEFVIEMATMKLCIPPETVNVTEEQIAGLEGFVADTVMQMHELAMVSPFQTLGRSETRRPPEMDDIQDFEDWYSLYGGGSALFGPNRVEQAKPARRKLALRKK